MERTSVIAALGFKSKGGSREAVIAAFRTAGQKGLSVAEIQAVAGNQSKSGDVSRTVASLISHLRKDHGQDVVKDENKYYLIGEYTDEGWVPQPWVKERVSRE